MLGGGRYQAATQVNVLSPEMFIVTEADTFHVEGRQHCCNREGEGAVALSGSKAAAWYYMEPIGTWEIQSTLRKGVAADGLKRGGGRDGALEVGPTHSRGVVRVMPGAGMGLTRRGWQLYAERGGNSAAGDMVNLADESSAPTIVRFGRVAYSAQG